MTPRAEVKRRRPPSPSREVILQLLRESFEGPAWHGPSVRDALRGVDHELAGWRPAPDRHSIWELTLHLAALRHRVRRRIRPDSTGRFPRRMAASWWATLPLERSAAAWRADVALLRDEHEQLITVVTALRRTELAAPLTGGRSIAEQLMGTALHDAYHAGQMVLLRRLEEA